MSYRESDVLDGHTKEFDFDPEADGSFEKASGVVYAWAPNISARKKRSKVVVQAVIGVALGFFLAAALLFTPSDFTVSIPQVISKTLDYKVLLAFTGLLLGILMCVVLYLETIVTKRKTAPSFVDLDERATSKRFDAQIRDLKKSLQKLRSSADKDLNLATAVVAQAKHESNTFSALENHINSITKTLDRHIELSEIKASKLLDTGTMYLRRGIYFYVASIFVWQIIAHVWGVDKQLVFGVVSCSLTFLVVEFLAAWFLKQYRSFVDSSIQFMRVKSVFDRYLLSYYAVKEFSEDEAENLAESKAQVLKVLAEEIRWPETSNTKAADMNHMVQLFESLGSVLEKLKKVSTKSEQAGA